MKLFKTIIFGLALTLTGFLSSCADYLDVVPDNTLTLEEIYTTKESAYTALASVYNFLPNESDTHATTWSLGDEFIGRLDMNNSDQLRAIRIMRGLQDVTDPVLGTWTGSNGGKRLYEGINQCEIFLKYIDNVRDMTDQEIRDWKAQVKFLKAYYCWLLVQKYGPIVLPVEGVIDPDASSSNLFRPRSKVEECFSYIINLMNEAIPDLTERATTNNQGQIDQIAAKALKAKVLLFRASPFFNGNREYYGDFYDHDGQPFFPMEYDNNKWKETIDALTEAITIAEANGKGIYTYEKEPFIYDNQAFEENPGNMHTLYDNRMVVCDPWNKELVWGISNINYYNEGELSSATNMRLPNGYGDGITNTAQYSWQWMAATYEVMSRYFTKNGLPIEEDLTFNTDKMFDVIVTPGEADSEYKNLWGIMQPGCETLEMYMNREPRFYANIAITGGYWRTHTVKIRTMMYQGKDGGFNSSTNTTDYYCTGIGLKKFVHPESQSGAWQRTIKYPYPIIRMADLYLMKAEALNEYSGPSQEVYDLINKVRKRAGIPNVETVWSDPTLAKTLNKHKTKEGLRDIILDERGVEFAFEGSHFWDMHRYKRAIREFSTPVSGWKYTGTSASTFFVLEAKQARRFSIRDCLWPIQLEEMNTNGELIQNPGW